jgi:hypothetical protein
MIQPILILKAGSDPTVGLAAEILRCEGFPWFSEETLEAFDGAPPEVKLIVVAGDEADARSAEAVARAAAAGTSVICLAPDRELGKAFGVTYGEAVTDAQVQGADPGQWEHGDLKLLCPGDAARPISEGEAVATFGGIGGHSYGSAIVEMPSDRGRVWLYGYDLCRTVATLRHGNGRLDPPEGTESTWTGPRALYSFWGLSEKLPHTVPVSDVHQDLLRTVLAEALEATGLPRLWHFQEGAPSVFMVRGDGCGEEGADVEAAVMEKHGAFLTFCMPPESRFSGELMREWDARGHGISIEANINGITTPRSRTGEPACLTAEDLNADHLDAIRQNLVAHRDTFHRETELEMETFMTHSAQWTGLPMARMVEELGWKTLLPFQSIDPRIPIGTERGPYAMPTALPMRYCDGEAGVLDLWHIPYQWIDRIWQAVAVQKKQGVTDDESLKAICRESGDDYGAKVARFAHEAASKWHVLQLCSFHPVYVSKPWPYLGSSQRALEMGLEGAKAAGSRFDNMERWSRFTRGRDSVRMTALRDESGARALTLESKIGVAALTVLLPDGVTEVMDDGGQGLTVQELKLEGRKQLGVVVDVAAGGRTVLAFRDSGQ